MKTLVRASHFILTATILLAACDKPHERSDSGDNAAIREVEQKTPAPKADSFSPEKAASGAAAGSPADKAIPAAFHGRWGMVPGDCGPDASIAKGLMVVNGKQLRFYESVGKPAVVTNPTPNRMEGRFSFTGEGQEWSTDMMLTLEGNGDKLVRTEKEPTSSYRYTRCPA